MENDKRIERIEAKVDTIQETIGEINTTLALQHESLREHMHRTSLLEEELLPIRKTLNKAEGIIDLLLVLAAVAALVTLFMEFFK